MAHAKPLQLFLLHVLFSCRRGQRWQHLLRRWRDARWLRRLRWLRPGYFFRFHGCVAARGALELRMSPGVHIVPAAPCRKSQKSKCFQWRTSGKYSCREIPRCLCTLKAQTCSIYEHHAEYQPETREKSIAFLHKKPCPKGWASGNSGWHFSRR